MEVGRLVVIADQAEKEYWLKKHPDWAEALDDDFIITMDQKGMFLCESILRPEIQILERHHMVRPSNNILHN